MSVTCPVYVVSSEVLKLGDFFEVAGSESRSWCNISD
jgi:hypothetical protein